jgi:hypothetical protein
MKISFADLNAKVYRADTVFSDRQLGAIVYTKLKLIMKLG